MPFRVCYYHVVWTTKHRAPLITPDIEPIVISALTQKSIELNNPVHAVNCVEDHIHVAVSIAVTLPVSEWIRNVKGRTTHEVNALCPDLSTRFGWQDGYGILTFGAKQLPYVVNYITRQKEHHREGTFQPYLERLDE